MMNEELIENKKILKRKIIVGSIAILLFLTFTIVDIWNPLGIFDRVFSSFLFIEILMGIMFLIIVVDLIIIVISIININRIEKGISRRISTIDTLNIFPIVLSVFLFIDAFLFSPVLVNGDSMQDTFYNNEVLITSHFNNNINIDDVVIIEKEDGEFIIKRVVAKPGDKLTVYVTGKVFVNDDVVEESINYYGTLKIYTNYILKEDEYYVLGDNRNVSQDSRYYGVFTKNQICGKVLFKLLPLDIKIEKRIKN